MHAKVCELNCMWSFFPLVMLLALDRGPETFVSVSRYTLHLTLFYPIIRHITDHLTHRFVREHDCGYVHDIFYYTPTRTLFRFGLMQNVAMATNGRISITGYRHHSKGYKLKKSVIMWM